MKAGASFQPEGIVWTSSVQSMFGEIHVNDFKGAHASRMANFTFCVYWNVDVLKRQVNFIR